MSIALQNKSVASLMHAALKRQSDIARSRFKLQPEQVQNLLLSYVKHENAKPYEELINILKDGYISDDNFRCLLNDCINCIVLLDNETKNFVETVCCLNWTSKESSLVELFTQWTLDLITVHIYYAPTVITALIRKFKREGEIWEEEIPKDISIAWSNVHTLIARIVAIVPMCTEILLQTVTDEFPYYKSSAFVTRSYIHNLIWISKYLPSITEPLITLIIQRLIVIDVNTGARDILEANNGVDTVAECLDYAMLEMLHWLQDQRQLAIEVLCGVFERVLLPTYGIKHIQFLVLYAVSISQACADHILSSLWLVASGGRGATATRRTAATHLAGLLARACRLPRSRLSHYLRTMAVWCHTYLDALRDTSSYAPSDTVHAAFHAVAHAIFYLIAFKYSVIFSDKNGLAFVESLNLPRIVTCSMNPLRTGPPQVVRAFASVTRAHQVAYCQAVIERNSRNTLYHNGTDGNQEHWFPYDPYTLPRSGEFIRPMCEDYKEWRNDENKAGICKGIIDSVKSEESSEQHCTEMDDDDYLSNGLEHTRDRLSSATTPGFKY